MPEIGTSGLMSEEGKRSDWQRLKPPRPSSTLPPLVGGLDGLTRLFVDQLLAQAVAGSLVDLPEGDPLA